MKKPLFPLLFFFILNLHLTSNAQNTGNDMSQTVYQFTLKTLFGDDLSLETYAGHPILIVNTASECGLTPQYEDLQELHEMYKDKGLIVLGFPANNFGAQEPGSDAKIANFCKVNYGVTFQMFSKISVKGSDQHPLYKFLTDKSLNGVLDAEMQWNFQKFLIDKDGRVAKVFSPKTNVGEDEVQNAILEMLN